MNEHDKSLLALKKVFSVGPRKIEERPLINRMKEFARIGLLSTVLLVQVLNTATAAVNVDYSNLNPTQTIEQIQPLDGFDNTSFLDNKISTTDNIELSADIGANESVSESHAIEAFEAESINNDLINPFSEIESASKYMDSNGVINGKAILEDWKDSGISNENILKLMQVLVVTQSPTIVADNVFNNVSGVSDRAQDLFTLDSNEAATEFLEYYSLDAFADNGLIAPGYAERQNVEAIGSDNQAKAIDYVWNNYVNTALSGTSDNVDSDISMKEAIANLKQAVNETGLASLKVPLPLWDNPDNINLLAQNLIDANNELSQATGFSGPVLGLNGVINMTVGIPNLSSFTQVSEDQVHIQTSFGSIGHEWAHGIQQYLDYTNHASHSLLENAISTIDSQSAHIDNSYNDKADSLHDHHSEKGYYQSYTEKFAFHAAAFFSNLQNGDSIISPGSESLEKIEKPTWDTSIRPTVSEANEFSSVWQNTFSELKTSFWDVQFNNLDSDNVVSLDNTDNQDFGGIEVAIESSGTISATEQKEPNIIDTLNVVFDSIDNKNINNEATYTTIGGGGGIEGGKQPGALELNQDSSSNKDNYNPINNINELFDSLIEEVKNDNKETFNHVSEKPMETKPINNEVKPLNISSFKRAKDSINPGLTNNQHKF